jgi:Zn-dependent peptidase ImmA (M78 family)
LIVEYGLTTPESIDVEAIAFDLGLLVIYAPLKGADARLLRRGSRGIIRVNPAIDLEGQRRFCVAHEVGHFLIHRRDKPLADCTASDMLSGYRESGQEPQANAFAAELLLPELIFRKLAPLNPGLATLENLAQTFRATLTAAAYRYVELGIAVCALVVSREGRIQWFLAGSDFHFSVRNPGSALDPRTCAGSFFRGQDVEKTEDDVPADAWLSSVDPDKSWTVRELMVPMPRYSSALSLLWVVSGSPMDSL